jgi:hypothetical protein
MRQTDLRLFRALEQLKGKIKATNFRLLCKAF